MKYELQHLRPLGEFDYVVTVMATPNWLERQLGRQKKLLRFCGSGTTWRNGRDGPRCGEATSQWLREVWRREVNLRLEKDQRRCEGETRAEAPQQ